MRKEKVDTEGGVLVLQIALELGNLVTEHLRSVSDTSDDTETTGVGDGRGQLGPGSHVHACQQDGVVDLEQISEGSLDFLYKRASAWSSSASNRRVTWCVGDGETYEERP